MKLKTKWLRLLCLLCSCIMPLIVHATIGHVCCELSQESCAERDREVLAESVEDMYAVMGELDEDFVIVEPEGYEPEAAVLVEQPTKIGTRKAPVQQKFYQPEVQLPEIVLEPQRQSSQERIKELFRGFDGFRCQSNDEVVYVKSKGGDSTYGEIPYETWAILAADLNLGPCSVVIDLGCGIGKMAVQVYLDSPAKKVVGIELCRSRYQIAKKVQNKMDKQNLLDRHRKLIFIYDDMLNARMRDATVIYTCSTCFSNDLMEKLMKKVAAECEPGLIFLTLKKLPPTYPAYGFKLLKEYNLKMTWGMSPVYKYEMVE